MELTQTNGFGVGVFWRNVILEKVMITRSYEPKVHLCGRGGEIRTPDHLVRSQVLYPAELRALLIEHFLSTLRNTRLSKIGIFGGEGGIRTLDEAINPILP